MHINYGVCVIPYACPNGNSNMDFAELPLIWCQGMGEEWHLTENYGCNYLSMS